MRAFAAPGNRTSDAGTIPLRVDYGKERADSATVFVLCDPLSGWRQASNEGGRGTGSDRLSRRALRSLRESGLTVGVPTDRCEVKKSRILASQLFLNFPLQLGMFAGRPITQTNTLAK